MTRLTPQALVNKLARPNILALTPYSSARDEAKSQGTAVAATSGLDANEAWAPLFADTPPLNRYPEPQPLGLRQRLAELWQAGSAERVVLGRGADDGIDWLVRAFCAPGRDAIALCTPTYGMYRVAADIQDVDTVDIPLHTDGRRFTLDSTRVLQEFPEKGKLLFLCSPNNPTSDTLETTALRQILDGLSGRALVVVDEAYLEYSQADSAARWLDDAANLVVLRTVSKAWGLAGARLGGVVAAEEIAGVLNRVRAPYPLPALTIDAVTDVVCRPEGLAAMRARVAQTIEQRQRLRAGLEGLAMVDHVFPSAANFLLVRFVDGLVGRAFDAALAAGIRLRDRRRELGCAGCLRITVGNSEQNSRLLAVLAQVSP